MPSETTVYKRDELYQQVWDRPIREVAAGYGVSDAALANACRKLDVPRPPNGYWAKKAAGQSIKPIPLPKPRPGYPTELQVVRGKVLPSTKATEVEPAPAPPAMEKKQADAPFSVEVSDTIDRPHKLIASALKGFKKGRVDREGLVEPAGDARLPVAVSPEQVARAMRLLDAIFKSIEQAGHKVLGFEDYNHPARFMVEGEAIGFFIRERLVRSEHVPKKGEFYAPKFDHNPSGDLRFKITYDKGYGRIKEWQDSKRASLESQAGLILKGIIQASADTKARREERQERERLWAEEAQRRRDREERKKEEERQTAAFVDMANRWENSRLLRTFLCAVKEEALRRFGSIDPGSPAAEWLEKVEAIAANLDPIPRLFEPSGE